MSKNLRLLREPGVFAKFCAKEDNAFGCKKAYGCYVACPLWRAREVEFLVNEKGMTIGEAHKASLREYIDAKKGREIIKEAIRGERADYPSDNNVTEYLEKTEE